MEKSYLISETAQVTEIITKLSPYTDQQTAQVTESISKDPLGAGVSPEWALGPYVPTGHTDTKREGNLDTSLIVYGAVAPTLLDNLVAYWKLDESSGNPVDASGNGKTLTNTNVTFSGGKINNAGSFNGSSSKLACTGVALGTEFSIQIWLYRASTVGRKGLMGCGAQGSGGGANKLLIMTSVVSSGDIYIHPNDFYTAGGVLTSGAWNHIVYTYSVANGSKIYVNGVSKSFTGAGAPMNVTDANWIFGLETLNNNNWLNGLMDEIAMWTRELTASEVTQLYNSGSAIQYPF